ncbi:MAG: NADH-quinone oxidoreductase subunit L [Bacteroidia bacterium]
MGKTIVDYVWLIPLFPLLGFLITGLVNRSLSKGLTGLVACGALAGSFLISLLIFLEENHTHASHSVVLFDWISSGSFHSSFAFLVDPLSSLFLMIITGVGLLIHIYSVGYMHDDDGFRRFFSYLNLFIFFMLLLVLGDNYLIMFVGWEGVGLCSYLLIGFWFKNPAFNDAAKKAFIMNRIGDLGFLLGILLIFTTFGTIKYDEVFHQASGFGTDNHILIAITLLLFIGAMGKSAQIPLYTWLPDAMAGPTPVSALIHAATMVTAGIYMVARSNVLYSLAPFSMEVVAGIGMFTALFAATIGIFQNDIKKVLAYSTVSQLGYMFLGLGVGAYTGAVFHVATHAFFKALLFLGSGSVIHAMSGEQDIRKMGGLKKALPITHATFLIGTIAISGLPPLAGFFSKDEILAHAWGHNKFFWILGILGSLMTCFYMFRLYFLTFHGKFRGTHDQEHHLHESPRTMTVPLIVLAALSIVGGFMGMPDAFMKDSHWLSHFLSSSVGLSFSGLSEATELSLMMVSVALLLVVIYFTWNLYVKKATLPVEEGAGMPAIQKVVYHKYYVDEFYEKVITKPLNWISEQTGRIIETRLIDGLVNGVGKMVNVMSGGLRLVQTGNIGFYLFAMVLSIVLMLFIKFF